MPPKVLAKPREDRATAVQAARAITVKTPGARLKLEIRRLPPALTLTEFEETLGDEWKLNNGNVDWREYRQGKIKSPGKLPEQSRCYIHLVSESLVKAFEQKFLSATFHDKAGTHKNPDLKYLPPMLGFAPYQRIPALSKPRADNRQGTIDQDVEFIAFLEAETQPIVKPAAIEVSVSDKETVRVKTTPLIEDLREKKASKAKAAASKAEKRKAADEDKTKKVEIDPLPAKGGKEVGAKQQPVQQKAEQAAKEVARATNKLPASKQQQHTTPQQANAASPARLKKLAHSAKTPTAAPALPALNAGPPNPAPQRGPPVRQRGNADGIKKMLQRDLGIRPKPAASGTPAPTATSATPAPPSVAPAPTPAPTPISQPQPAPKTHAPAPHPPTTKAYLKHANPSQGMTEILIQQALAPFGEVLNVTIDPRKGTAIAMFKDGEGLKKALEARKVPVAQGAVEVLEFREVGQRKGATAGEGRGRGGGFRGGRGGRAGRGGAEAGAGKSEQAPAAPAAGG